LGAKLILKKSGTTMMLRWETPAFSFAVTKSPERGVSSPYLSTKGPTVLAGEFNLTALPSMCELAFSEDGGCWLLQEKVPLMKRPRERNSTLNKTDKMDNFFFTRDIFNFTLALIGARSTDIGLQKKFICEL
jgi:hypothetical protein